MMNNSTKTAAANTCIDIGTAECFCNLGSTLSLLKISPIELKCFIEKFDESLLCDPSCSIVKGSESYNLLLEDEISQYFLFGSFGPSGEEIDFMTPEYEEIVETTTVQETACTSPKYQYDQFGIKQLNTDSATVLQCGKAEVDYLLPTLVGGNPRYRRKKRKYGPKKRKNIRTSAPSAVQEGQINLYNPRPRNSIEPIKFNVQIVADALGNVSRRFSVRNPQRAVDGSGTYVNATDLAALFDQYKVLQYILQYFPASPVQPGVVATAFDWDAPDAATPNYANTLNYANCKTFTACKPFQIRSRVPYLTEGTLDTDGARPCPIHQNGNLDYAGPPVQGNFILNMIQCTPLSVIGAIVCTMLIESSFRR
jgi:hypothetical protein